MSKYTTQLRFICESLAGNRKSVNYLKVDEVIEAARPQIFDFTYPLPAEHKEEFEKQFLLHFYARELGYETYGYWKLKLRSRLNLICPKYAKLLATENLITDPFDTYGKKTVTSGSNNRVDDTDNTKTIGGGWSDSNNASFSQRSEDNDKETGKNKEYASYTDTDKTTKGDTPQGGATSFSNTYQSEWNQTEHIVSRTNPENSITNGTLNTVDRTHNNEVENNQSAENFREYNNYQEKTENTLETRGQSESETLETGYGGINKSQYLEDYRKTFINILYQLINELDTLFIQLW